MDDTTRISVAFFKEDFRKLQVLQNKTLRYKTGSFTLNAPTSDLMDAVDDLSIHQFGAYHTLVIVFRIVTTGEHNWNEMLKTLI